MIAPLLTVEFAPNSTLLAMSDSLTVTRSWMIILSHKIELYIMQFSHKGEAKKII